VRGEAHRPAAPPSGRGPLRGEPPAGVLDRPAGDHAFGVDRHAELRELQCRRLAAGHAAECCRQARGDQQQRTKCPPAAGGVGHGTHMRPDPPSLPPQQAVEPMPRERPLAGSLYPACSRPGIRLRNDMACPPVRPRGVSRILRASDRPPEASSPGPGLSLPASGERVLPRTRVRGIQTCRVVHLDGEFAERAHAVGGCFGRHC
jgi:hypothetical protein